MCLIPFFSLKTKCHFLFLLCLPFPTDGVFGRCQKVPVIDIDRYEVSPLVLQRLTATLQKLSRTGRRAWPKTVSWDWAHFWWLRLHLVLRGNRGPLRWRGIRKGRNWPVLQWREADWEQAGLLMECSGGSFLRALDAALACRCACGTPSTSVPASESPRDLWSGRAGSRRPLGSPLKPTWPHPTQRPTGLPNIRLPLHTCLYASFCYTVLSQEIAFICLLHRGAQKIILQITII